MCEFSYSIHILDARDFYQKHNEEQLAATSHRFCWTWKDWKVNVLILGAGAAGISAAKTLYDQGITDFLAGWKRRTTSAAG